MSKVKCSAFTLIESIIYIGITAVVVLSLITMTWSFINNHTKGMIVMKVNDNANFFISRMDYLVTRADEIGDDSVFGSNPGVLEIGYPSNPTVIVDTYEKDVDFGGETITITKLRLSEVGVYSFDLTTDGVSVSNFVLTDLSDTSGTTIQIELTVESPVTTTKIYEYSKSFTTSSIIKKK